MDMTFGLNIDLRMGMGLEQRIGLDMGLCLEIGHGTGAGYQACAGTGHWTGTGDGTIETGGWRVCYYDINIQRCVESNVVYVISRLEESMVADSLLDDSEVEYSLPDDFLILGELRINAKSGIPN